MSQPKRLSSQIPKDLKPPKLDLRPYYKKIRRLMAYDKHVLAITLAGLMEKDQVDVDVVGQLLKMNKRIRLLQLKQILNEQLDD
jgi:hypothetical protein